MKRILVTGGSGFIGTNLIAELVKEGHEVLNVDKVAPRNTSQSSYWTQVDILDYNKLEKVLREFSPDFIVHLAAVTDLDGKTAEYYKANTEGTNNIIMIAATLPTLRRVLFTSSMYVCQPGYIPKDYDDYKPHTPYGQSKVDGELIVKKSAKQQYDWVIIRPTSIWGPWFGIPYIDFFRVVYQGQYYDFGSTCTKTYGYVENAVHQVKQLLNATGVHGKTFYIGDEPPIPIAEWANEISNAMGKGSIKKIPYFAIKMAALGGDILTKAGIKFPMTSFRLANMQTNNILPVEPLHAIAGPGPVSRLKGVEKTVSWLREHKGYKV